MYLIWTPQVIVEKVSQLSKPAIQIYLTFAREIGDWSNGMQEFALLTSREDLVKEFGFSRDLVDAAILELAAHGLIRTRKRWIYMKLEL